MNRRETEMPWGEPSVYCVICFWVREGWGILRWLDELQALRGLGYRISKNEATGGFLFVLFMDLVLFLDFEELGASLFELKAEVRQGSHHERDSFSRCRIRVER